MAYSSEKPANPAEPVIEKQSIEDVIPITVGNMRGHKMLYDEGWLVVTSSSRAFDYAKRKAILSSADALKLAMADTARHSGEYKTNIKEDIQDSVKTGKNIVTTGTKRSGRILEKTHDLANKELSYAQEGYQKAMAAFVQGNLTLPKRTAEERQELANLPGNYFTALNADFGNVYVLAEQARKKFSDKIEPEWDMAFQKASRAFQSEYEQSGNEKNTLMALGPILYGYLKAFYQGLVAPASKTIVKAGVVGTSYAVFLPVAATSVVAGRTIQSVGLTVYYVGKTGVKIISPTMEGGLLSGLSLLSLSAVPVTYAAGGAVGAINQVAFTTAGPVAATVEATAKSTVHTAGYVGFLAYDAVKGTTRIVINQAASGVVLGYNALTAVPTHALLGVVDTAVFLAWDGPRLVIAAARGRIKDSGTETYSLGDLPIGTVVDLKKLEKAEGVKVEVLSSDPVVIQKVLEQIPNDAREADDVQP